MNKKKLPKAIMRTTGDLRQATAGPVTTDQGGCATNPEHRDESRSAGPTAGVESNPVQPAAPQEKFPPVERALAARETPSVEFDVTRRRRALAYAIVQRYATYSAGCGIIPLPIANVASVTAINIRMVKMLSNIYGVPFERDRTRAIVVGLAAGAMPTGLAAATTSTLYFVLPTSAIIALAVSSVTAAACTSSIGRVFVEHFESGKGLV